MTAWTYHNISKEVENQIFKYNWIFKHLCIYKQPTLTKQWKYNTFVQILYIYFRYTGRLFLGCTLFVTQCNIIRASYETKNKRLSFRKIHRKICVRDMNFLAARHPFYVILCCFLCLLPSFSQLTYLLNEPCG